MTDHGSFGLEPDDLDGHTIDELSDYLDSGRNPIDPSIESSPGCRMALAALERLRSASSQMLEAEAAIEPEPEEGWITGILQNISREVRSGRSIPIPHPDAAARLAITEGSVRALVRAAGDSIDGLMIGRCALDGDVTEPGAPVTVSIDATVYWGRSIPQVTEQLRIAVFESLALHTDLDVVAVDITVHDVHLPPQADADGKEAGR